VKNRFVRHTAFWILYFAVILFNDVFLSYSFTEHPSWQHIMKAVATLMLLLTIKIPLVYYVLYSFISGYQRSLKKVRKILELILVVVFAVMIYRILVHFVIWEHIWQEPPQTINTLQYVARIFYSVLDILQVVGLAAAIKLFRLRIEAIKKEKYLQREKLQAELLQLKSQLNPHFLFNTLNSIYALARAKSEDTADVVMKLSSILRYMLYRGESTLATVQEEFRIVDDYLQLQQIRFGEKRKIKITRSIDNEQTGIPPLMILTLLENIYKHGAANDENAHCIIRLSNNILEILTSNRTLSEMKEDIAEKGIGLSNLNRQLELLFRDFNFRYFLKDSIFNVHLTINLNSYAGDELFDSRG